MQNPISLRLGLRESMPITRQFAYLDHAAVCPLPWPTNQAIQKYCDQATHQGDICWLQWSAAAQRTRELAAKLIEAAAEEIALVGNTTQGITIVSEGFPWQSGDNVVVPDNEFPSNLLPWRLLESRGVELRLVRVPPSEEITADLLAPYIDQKTRLVSVSWVGFASGYRCDLAAICDLVHERGSLLLVDAIQGLGAFPLSVREIPIDFLAADGHKWMLGPEGAGILYIHPKQIDRLRPLSVGWNSLAGGNFDSSSTELKTSAARFEGGSTNMVGMIALGASLNLLAELNHSRPNGCEAAILENVAELESMLLSAEFETKLSQQPHHRSGIVGITWLDAASDGDSVYWQARKQLLSQNVVVSVRGGRLRAATHAYNNSKDHQRLVDGLVEFRRHN